MAIHYPKLFCPKGTVLESIREIGLEDSFTVKKGEKLYVYNIIGYGYDLHILLNKEIFFRVKNSQMKDFFKIIAFPYIDDLNNQDFKKAFFAKDFELDGNVIVKKGVECFYEEEVSNGKTYYNIYDNYDKILRFKEIEAIEYLSKI